MRVLQSKWFARFVRQENISDKMLIKAVTQIENGLIDADLGGNVFKQRVARSGQGKSSGYRVIILLKQKERAIFVYGFSKNHQENISQYEVKVFKQMAQHVLSLSDEQFDLLIDHEDFIKVENYD